MCLFKNRAKVRLLPQKNYEYVDLLSINNFAKLQNTAYSFVFRSNNETYFERIVM